ncbi:MAG: helix-turn-helix transcriptional regulator [Lachnospiraceae bacterium]
MRINRIKLVTELTRQDMTQAKLAELSGVSRATVNFIKNGKSCSDKTVGKIAKALKVPVENLIDMESEVKSV